MDIYGFFHMLMVFKFHKADFDYWERRKTHLQKSTNTFGGINMRLNRRKRKAMRGNSDKLKCNVSGYDYKHHQEKINEYFKNSKFSHLHHW